MKNSILILSVFFIFACSVFGQQKELLYADVNQSSGNQLYANANHKEARNETFKKELNHRAISSFNLAEYINSNLIYPDLAQANFVEGQVLAEVSLDAEGKVMDVTIIKGLGFGCDEQVIKVLKDMPQWIPAIRKGTNVAQNVIIPVQFQLQ
jgi:TonB family protein